MKLRIKGNSVRLRLTRPEVARLNGEGSIEEAAEFGPGEVLKYGIEASGASETWTTFRGGSVRVILPKDQIQQWASSEDVGIYGDAGGMTFAIEKDFQCLTRPEERLDPDIYPHPEAGSKHGHSHM